MPNNLVGLQVPTLHLLVLGTREQVWVSFRNGQSTNRRDMTSQRQLQLARRQIPDLRDELSVTCAGVHLAYLDYTVSSSCREPLISWVYSYSSHPPHMTRDDSCQFPYRLSAGRT